MKIDGRLTHEHRNRDHDYHMLNDHHTDVGTKRKVKGGEIMAREKEHYRDNLMRLKEQFPDREFITTKEAAAFCGMCVDTFKKYFKPKRPRISISQLASFIS